MISFFVNIFVKMMYFEIELQFFLDAIFLILLFPEWEPETETGRGIGAGTTFGGARRGGDEKQKLETGRGEAGSKKFSPWRPLVPIPLIEIPWESGAGRSGESFFGARRGVKNPPRFGLWWEPTVRSYGIFVDAGFRRSCFRRWGTQPNKIRLSMLTMDGFRLRLEYLTHI
jgi:hypothetical protein